MINSSRRLAFDSLSSPQKNYYSTNEVVEIEEESGDMTYYLPCYVRFLLKEIQKVNAEEMEATVSGTLLFSFYYGSVERSIVEQFTGNESGKAVLLQFNQEQSLLMKQGKGISMKEDEKEQIIDFVIRKSFRTFVKGDVFLTPFQTLDLYLSVTVQTVHLGKKDRNHKINIKFNCMDSTQVDVLGHGEELSFGYYRIASNHMEWRSTNSRKYPFKPIAYLGKDNDEQQEIQKDSEEETASKEVQEVRAFQYSHFRIPIYKFPALSILTIFIPIWILGLIGLFVFYQEPGFGARLATIAVLALAFVAFLPTINQSIPKSPDVKLVDILILMHLAAIILLLVESYSIRQEDKDSFVFVWSESKLFIASLVLNSTTFLAIAILFIVHKCIWERKYRKIRLKPNKKYKKLIRKSWRNRQCDKQFAALILKGKANNK